MKNIRIENRFIITSCSDLKKKYNNLLAIQLYNGPSYKIIRKHDFPPSQLYIISAKYGLIRGDTHISHYDQKMTPKRANELSETVSNNINKIIEIHPDADIFINLGKTYALSILGAKAALSNKNVTFASGKIGERLHQLKTWLLEE